MFTEKKEYRPSIAKIFIGILFFILYHSDLKGVREEIINKSEVFVSVDCYRLNRTRMPEILLLKRPLTENYIPTFGNAARDPFEAMKVFNRRHRDNCLRKPE
jgi:hypothetical protein